MFMVKTSEYDSPQSISSGKRKKGEEDANGLISKKQRTRVRCVPNFLKFDTILSFPVFHVENAIAENRRYFHL